MRIVTLRKFGGPEVLEVIEADRPQGPPTEVIVRVRAVGLNPVEAYIRSGAFPIGQGRRTWSTAVYAGVGHLGRG